MKEVIDLELLEEAENVIASLENEEMNGKINSVHCSWCTNCAGIVGD
jgi:hypothetical protein